MRQDNPELGEQTTDAVDTCRALLFEAFTQSMHAQHALLVDGFNGHKAHLWAAGSFADGSRIIGIILAAFALHAIWSNFYTDVQLAPLTAVLSTMLFALPLAFAQELDACRIHQ